MWRRHGNGHGVGYAYETYVNVSDAIDMIQQRVTLLDQWYYILVYTLMIFYYYSVSNPSRRHDITLC